MPIERERRRSGVRVAQSSGRVTDADWLTQLAPPRDRPIAARAIRRAQQSTTVSTESTVSWGACLTRVMCSMPGFSSQLAGWQRRNIMADNDKKPMSRLMKLANKFNCFYLSGKRYAMAYAATYYPRRRVSRPRHRRERAATDVRADHREYRSRARVCICRSSFGRK